MEKKITVVTHSSGFHTDDIFAMATLLLMLGKEVKVEVVRTRNMEIIDKADYVVDVGGVYNVEKKRFDHHQTGGAGKRDNGIPYASFGLVWKTYGIDLCESLQAAQKIDQMIVQPIDALDNGIQFQETKIPGLHSFDISSIPFLFYPTWKEDHTKIDDTFLELVSYAKGLLERAIVSTREKLEAEKLVEEIYLSSNDKRLIILPNSRYPWEEVLSKFHEPLYVVYKNITDDTWALKGVRSDLFNYETRKKLPEDWAGKSGEELEKITGVKGAVFCHNARFMAVAKTKEAILQMAEIALNK